MDNKQKKAAGKTTSLKNKIAFLVELGKNKVRQIKMVAKQKSCRIIDIENRFFVSGASDAQEKSYMHFNI